LKGIETSDLCPEIKSIYFSNKKTYYSWLKNNFCNGYSTSMINRSFDLFSLFENRHYKPKEILLLIEQNQLEIQFTLKSFRNWLNFCEKYEYLSDQVIDRYRNKIKLVSKYSVDTYIPSKTEIEISLNIIQNKYQREFYLMYKFILESGCRFTEFKKFILEFDNLKLEICDLVSIYRLFYIRGSKSSFYLFSSNETLLELKSLLLTINIETLNNFLIMIQRNKEIVNLKYLRKYQFTLLIKNDVNLEIANFIQGRTSKNVGFNHYLAKKELALKEFSKLYKYLNLDIYYE
jgi:intergrase/recombinase